MSVTRIKLKRLKSKDVTQSYVGWLNDTEINQYLESRYEEHTLESTKAFVAKCEESETSLLFGIFLLDNTHIGNIKLELFPRYRKAEIGILIGEKSCWGKGYATEAIQLICRYAEENFQLHKLMAGCYSENTGSARAFVKAGFEIEATLKDEVILNNRFQSLIRMAKFQGN